MDTPDVASSPSESLTSKGTEDLELELGSLGAIRNTPPRTSASAPSTPVDKPLNGDGEIVAVDAPPKVVDDSLMLGVEDEDEEHLEEDSTMTPPNQKRKRASVNYILHDSPYADGANVSPVVEPRAKRRAGPKIRGILIGVWRDSDQPDDEDKHVIYGFIDVHDRLRTRIYAMNKRGEELIGNVPTGAGGCWVTVERIIFENHLKELNPAQLKEYVKLREDHQNEDEAAKKKADLEAVEKAKLIAAQNVAAAAQDIKPATHPRRSIGRPSNQRESIGGNKATGFQAVNATANQTPKVSPAETKAPGILLGWWRDSDQVDLNDKHAIFGVVSENDCLKIKVQKLTRDGRRVEGNFPTGAGAMWIAYDKLVLDAALASLTRPEIKEYCRIRQLQIETKESDEERSINEAKAIQDAKAIVSGQLVVNKADFNGHPTPEPELRHSARSELKQQQARQQAEVEAAAQRTRQDKKVAMLARQDIVRKEVAIAEAKIKGEAEKQLKQNINSLNKVWMAQQNATRNGGSPAGSCISGCGGSALGDDDVKYHNGIKYERKKTGPFQGKLVGQPQMFQIDGEDYVEYRVLTKPSFF